MRWDDPVSILKGIGPATAEKLEKLSIWTLEDLLYHLPMQYEDRQLPGHFRVPDFNEKRVYHVFVDGEPRLRRMGYRKSVLEIPIVQDGLRGVLTFFNQPYMMGKFKPGQWIDVYGKLGQFGGRLQLANPVLVTNAKDQGLIPIYGMTKGITSKQIAKWMEEALALVEPYVVIGMETEDLNVVDLLRDIHQPKTREDANRARQALAFQELVLHQVGMLCQRETQKEEKAWPMDVKEASKRVLEQLPFQLTQGQEEAWKTIQKSLTQKIPMNTLVQGDVGSGKTALACLAMYAAAKNHSQAVLMAPTEILAIQHYQSITSMLAFDPNIRFGLLIGQMTEKQKRDMKTRIAEGDVDVVIGTHALLEDDVIFQRLSLTITDEQHRFGVKQRQKLMDLNRDVGLMPHSLSLTATPIPRSLALILYGEMEIVEIRGLPPGRKPVETYIITPALLGRAWDFVKNQIEDHKQVYMVCPMIEDNEDFPLTSVESLVQDLQQSTLKGCRIGALHGKMTGAEKEETMARFARGELDILVSTTVVEVGVNVPNATVMMIYQAERFGLSQIHQLRGRVGRGESQSYCILVYQGSSQESLERMQVLKSSQDGFVIAQKDLSLRGPGELLGYRQHGVPQFVVADLALDFAMLPEAREYAEAMLSRGLNESEIILWKRFMTKIEGLSR